MDYSRYDFSCKFSILLILFLYLLTSKVCNVVEGNVKFGNLNFSAECGISLEKKIVWKVVVFTPKNTEKGKIFYSGVL